jgi:electron transfer flavoprotein beta subunit
MKITVCFKAITDYTRMSPKDWEWDERHFVDTSFVRRIFNCFEESALEMALKLSKTSEDGSDPHELTAITVDDQQGDLFLKQLMAVGYDHGVRIQCEKEPDLRFNPLAISHLISAYIKQQGQDLVILGMQGGEGDNCQTGFFVAESLGWPCIREVSQFVMDDQSPDSLKVFSRIDGATLVQIVKLPLVLIIGHSLDSPYLRVPNLRQKLKAKKKQVIILSDIELGLGQDTGKKLETNIKNDKTIMHLQKPQASQPCAFIEGNNAREQARLLYDKFLKKRLSL